MRIDSVFNPLDTGMNQKVKYAGLGIVEETQAASARAPFSLADGDAGNDIGVPVRYLVAECTAISTPQLQAFWRYGVAKVLSQTLDRSMLTGDGCDRPSRSNDFSKGVGRASTRPAGVTRKSVSKRFKVGHIEHRCLYSG